MKVNSMDKLRPILKQAFWIGTGFVVLFAVGGWWMAMGSLDESIEKDQKTLAARVKASQAGDDAPNENWAQAAREINAEYRTEFSSAERELHRSQMSTRQFPSGPGGNDLARLEFLSPIDDRPLRSQYKELYLDHFLEQIKILDPFIVDENRGLIDVDPSQIAQADMSSWNGREPTSSEIWTAQEDLWLLRSLCESIAKVNLGSERLGTSPVRQLVSLELRGGDPSAAADGTGGTLGGIGLPPGLGLNAASFSANTASPGGGAFGGKNGGNAGGPRSSKAARAHPGMSYVGSFEADVLTEEFGPPPGNAGATGGGSKQSKKKGKDDDWGDSWETPAPKPPVSIPTADTGSGLAAEVKDRYVDDKAEYRTRAFLLHVRVTQDDIPSLLAELTNSSFPVEIVRVSAKFNEGTAAGQGRASGMDDGGRGSRGKKTNSRDRGFNLSGRGRPSIGGGPGMNLSGRNSGRPGLSLRGPQSERRSSRSRGAAGLLSRLASTEHNPDVAAKGAEHRRSALTDVSLTELRIGGLLTLYRTKEENLAAEETEQLDVLETQDATSDLQGTEPRELETEGAPLSGDEPVPDATSNPDEDIESAN